MTKNQQHKSEPESNGKLMKESNTGRGRYDLIDYEFIRALEDAGCTSVPQLIQRMALRLEIGANKYNDNNWMNGKKDDFKNSLLRHVNQYRLELNDEDHIAAAACNLMFMYWHGEKEKPNLKISECNWSRFYRYYDEMCVLGMAIELCERIMDYDNVS